MNAKQTEAWVQAQMRAAEAKQRMRMRTAGECGTPQDCDVVPFGERVQDPNEMPSTRPRRWYVVSSRNPDGTIRAAEPIGAGVFLGAQGFVINVPVNLCLWKFQVIFTSAAVGAIGLLQVGANNPPIEVPPNVPFDLDTTNFPEPLCGPLDITLRTAIPGDPVIAVPAVWHAIIGDC